MKKLLILTTSALLMAACSTDSTDGYQTESDSPVPILLGTSMETVTRSNSQTLQATELEDGTTVGVYIYHNATTTTASTGYGYKNLAYTAGNATGDLTLVTAADQPYFPQDKSKTIDIYAFAPRVYTATAELSTLTAQNVFTTTADQTTDASYRASDFVWGKAAAVTYATASSTTSKIEIPLKHKLSKVNINIAPGSGMALSQLAHARIKLNGVILLGTVDFTTGVVTTRSGATASSVILTSNASTTATTTFTSGTSTLTACTSSAVIIPQSVAASTSFITVELWDGTAYTTAYNVTTTAATSFAAEKVYTYNIIVNSQGLSLTTTIADWTSAGSAISGTAE